MNPFIFGKDSFFIYKLHFNTEYNLQISKFFFSPKCFKGLNKDLFILLVGYAIYAIGQWLFLLILFKCDKQFAGQYSYALALTGPLVTLAFLHLRPLFISDSGNQYPFKEIFALRVILIIFSVFVFTTFSFFLGVESETRLVILYVGFFRLIEGLNDIVYGVYQKQGKILKMGISLLLRGIFPLVFIILLSYFNTLYLVPFALLFSTLIVIFFDRRIIIDTSLRLWNEKINFLLLKVIVRKSFYLGLVGLLMALIPNIPRYFIKYFFGFEKLALFSTVSYIVVIGTLISSAISDSTAVKLSKIVVQKDMKVFFSFYNKAIRYSILLLILLLLGIGLGNLFIAQYQLYFISSEVKNLVCLGILIIPFLILSNLFMSIIFTFGYIKTQFWMYFIECIILSLFCSFLVPKFGLMGAFYAISVMYLAVIFILHIIIISITKEKLGRSHNLKSIL